MTLDIRFHHVLMLFYMMAVLALNTTSILSYGGGLGVCHETGACMMLSVLTVSFRFRVQGSSLFLSLLGKDTYNLRKDSQTQGVTDVILVLLLLNG